MSTPLRSLLTVSFLSVVCLTLVPAVTCDFLPLPIGPTLEGSWAGTITANSLEAVSESEPADINDPQATLIQTEFPFLTTFSGDGVPDKLLVIVPPIGSRGMEPVEVNIFEPGESVTLDQLGRQLTVTVDQAFYTPTYMRVVLSTSTAWTSLTGHITGTIEETGTGTATHTIEARPNTDGAAVLWTQTVEGQAHVNTIHRWLNGPIPPNEVDNLVKEGESWEAHRVDAAVQAVSYAITD